MEVTAFNDDQVFQFFGAFLGTEAPSLWIANLKGQTMKNQKWWDRVPKEAPPIKATMEVEIPGPVFEEFVLFVFNCPDFLCYIDHWAAPVYENDVQCANEEGLLIVERDEVEEDDETSIIKAVKAWRAKKKLPRYFHAITREVCLKAYLEGVRLYGVKWHEHPDCDMHTYDMAFQHALLPSNRWAY